MDKQIAQQVLTAILGQESLENAIGVFHMAVDKEIAQMAAYKSLGLDPRDVQKFGWLQMIGAKEPNVNVTQTQAPPANGSSKPKANGSGWLKGALVGAGLLAGGTGAGLGINAFLKPVPAAVTSPAATLQAWDAVTLEQQADGTWKEINRERLK